MSIIEFQFSSTRMNDLLKNAVHELFLQVNPFAAPWDQTILIHHVDIPDFSFTPSSGSVVAKAQPTVWLVPLANVFAHTNTVAPATETAQISITLTLSDNAAKGEVLVQCASVDLSALSGALTASLLQTLQQSLLNLQATIDLLQFLPLPQIAIQLFFGTFAVSADSTHVAIRADIGTPPDPNFEAFKAGTFPDRLFGQDWSVSIGGQLLTADVQLLFTNILKGISAIDVVEGPTCTWSAPPPTVNTFINATTSVDSLVVGVNLNATSVFELAPYLKAGGTIHVLRLDTTFTASAPNVAEAILFGLLGVNLTQFVGTKLAGSLPKGATMVSSNEFVDDIDMPQISMLEATGAQTLVTSDSNGLVIAGDLKSTAKQDADFTPSVIPFLWVWYDLCSDHTANKGAYLNQVKCRASAILGGANKPAVNRNIHIWYLGEYVPVDPWTADLKNAFGPYLSMPLMDTDVTAVDIEIAFTAQDFQTHHSDYWSPKPYPCTLLCITSAGSMYLSLGEVEPLHIDPNTGKVMNALTVFVNDCYYVAVDPWYIHFRSYNPSWSIDPYVGERVEQIAGIYPASEILQVELRGAEAGEAIVLESQDLAAQTSTRTVLADRSGKAQFTAYLPWSANPAPLQVSRARNTGQLQLTSLQRTVLTQSIRLTMSESIERIAGEVVGGKSLLQVFTAAGTLAFDVSDPGQPQKLESDSQAARRGCFGWSRPRATPAAVGLPAGLVQIGDIFAAVDRRRNTVVLFRSQTSRDTTAAG